MTDEDYSEMQVLALSLLESLDSIIKKKLLRLRKTCKNSYLTIGSWKSLQENAIT